MTPADIIAATRRGEGGTRRGPASPPRVIEIGDLPLFRWTHPAETWCLYFFGGHPQFRERRLRRWGLGNLIRLRAALRGADVELVVCHPPQREPGLAGVFFGDLRRLACAALGRLGAAPLVVTDFRDEMALNPFDFTLLERAGLYFKRELPIDRDRLLPRSASRALRETLGRNLSKLRPVSVGLSAWREAALPPDPADRAAKSIDLFFAGNLHSPARTAGVRVLERLSREGFRVEVCEGLSHDDFMRRCARSWLVWSPDGFGWDCFRHYEAAAAGSVPVMTRPAIERFRPLEANVHALFYDPAGADLYGVVRAALEDRERLRRMGSAARAHVLANLTHPGHRRCHPRRGGAAAAAARPTAKYVTQNRVAIVACVRPLSPWRRNSGRAGYSASAGRSPLLSIAGSCVPSVA